MSVTDTTHAARAVQIQVLRELGPERRSQLAFAWSEQMREIALQGVRDRQPQFSERRVVLEYARMTLGDELFREAFASEAAALE